MIKRNTQQGNIILDVIKKAERPLTPIEIHQKAILKSPRIGIATTYRHLKVLSEGNQVVGVDYPGHLPAMNGQTGRTRYIFPAVPVINFSRWMIPRKITHQRKLQVDTQFRASRLCCMVFARSAGDILRNCKSIQHEQLFQELGSQ